MKVKGKILILTLAALALGAAGAGVAPVAAQERERRRELERRARELREELQDIERQLTRSWGDARVYSGPGIVTWLSNRTQLGVFVRTAADDEVDQVGAELESVTSGGPAEEAGLEAGDVITSFEGERLTGRYPPAGPDESEPAIKLIDLVREKEPGDEVTVEYQRDGQSSSTIVTLGGGEVGDSRVFTIRPRSFVGPRDVRVRVGEPGGLTVISVFGDMWLDMELVTLNEDLGRYFGTGEGLLIIRPPEDDELGLQSGDVILSIDGREPRSPSRALRILRSYEPGETVNLEIMRDRSQMTVSVDVPERERRRDGGIWGW